ncbi:MAG TPA: motility protein MotB [Chromatiales bacterium]|nr:motility protein MotB [Chromatiales bacterium]
MADDKKHTIVVKKIRKGGHGHHGGAWKVALADFVTAMMAFFLLMWLLEATTEEQLGAISEYFRNPSAVEGTSATPSSSPSVQGPGGASDSMIDFGGTMDVPKGRDGEPWKQGSPEEVERLARELERRRLEELMAQLKAAIERSQALKPFKDQLLLDITPEGLRIQIVDKENRPMFDLGSAQLKPYTVQILHELARFINEVPNRISISGHTDARPYVNRADYSNWELSTDRANAARRELVAGGMDPKKVGRIVGFASTVLFDKKDPYNPINRRISIIVMNKETEEAMRGMESAHPPAAPERAAKAKAPAPAAPEPRG